MQPPEMYLTRHDIAERLQISEKQAGRLMQQMRCLPVGKRSLRVSESNFKMWIYSHEREMTAKAPAKRQKPALQPVLSWDDLVRRPGKEAAL